MSGGYTVPSIDLKAYARRGAEARIAELTAELNDIYKAFPDLRTGGAKASAGGGRGSEIGNGAQEKAPWNDGGSEGRSVEADEEVLGGEAQNEQVN
jgi:hypothetical protein